MINIVVHNWSDIETFFDLTGSLQNQSLENGRTRAF